MVGLKGAGSTPKLPPRRPLKPASGELQANFNGWLPFGKGEAGPNLGRPTKVGSYAPNKLGLYDMHGNVWQFCEDLYVAGASPRVVRGGSWVNNAEYCTAAIRAPAGGRQYMVGFRLARVPVR